MTFAEFLEQVGGMGRFQYIQTLLLTIPVLLMASHNLLQNFTAAIPGHHCRIHVAANVTEGQPNATRLLGAEDLLRVAIPTNSRQQPEKCRRFVHAQWHLLNRTAETRGGANETEMDTEPCADGWEYDRTMYSSTIITEVRRAGST